MIDPETRERADEVFRRFVALPIEADGSIRVPPALRREMIDLALDVMAGDSEKAKAGTPTILAMLTRNSS